MFSSIGRAVSGAHDGDARDFSAVADRIARSLLEIDVPTAAGIEIGIRAAPARIVGGDYLDVVLRPDLPGSIVFAIGDASGKSLPAALKAMMLKYLVRGLVRVLGGDVAQIVRRVNEVVCEDIERDSYITLNLATIAADRRSATFAVAGHDPALVRRGATGAIDELSPGGLLLGYDANTTYRAETVAVAPGDTIVLYTDGFTEAMSPSGEQYTLARLKESIRRHGALGAQDLADRLFEDVERHSEQTMHDDTSVVVVRIVD